MVRMQSFLQGGVHTSLVCKTFKPVNQAIASLRREYIEFWCTPAALRNIARNVCEMKGVSGDIDAMDCTHAPTQSPGSATAELFRIIKNNFSISVQSVSDDKLMIRDIVARREGSVHDRTIFNNSASRACF